MNNAMEKIGNINLNQVTEITTDSLIELKEILVNSANRTVQTLVSPVLVGTIRKISNRGRGLVRIEASNGGTIVGLTYLPLLKNEDVELKYDGLNNWSIVSITPRLRIKKCLNVNSPYLGQGYIDIYGSFWYQPSPAHPSKLDGSTNAHMQKLTKQFPKDNPNIVFTDKSVFVGNTMLLHDTNNNLWGAGENEGGQLNQGNQTDVYELKLIHTNVAEFFYPDSPGVGSNWANLIIKTTDGHVKFIGVDNHGQSGVSPVPANNVPRTRFIVLTTGHVDSQASFTRVCSTTNLSNIVTITSGGTNAALILGQKITGTGIPANTTVTGLISTNQFTISNNATATTTSNTITFYGWMAQNTLKRPWIGEAYTAIHIIWEFHNGEKYATGYNGQGGHGNGTTTNSSTPIDITSFWGRLPTEPANDGLNWVIVKAKLRSLHYTDQSYYNSSTNMLLVNKITGHTRNQRSGDSNWGGIGNNSTTNVLSPYLVASSIATDTTPIAYKGKIVDIGSQGGSVLTNFVVFDNGTVYVNGRDDSYQCGLGTIGTNSQRNSPLQLFEKDGITPVTNATKILSDNFNLPSYNWYLPVFIKRINGITAHGYNGSCGTGTFTEGLVPNTNVTRPTKVQIDYESYGECISVDSIGYDAGYRAFMFLMEAQCVFLTGRNNNYQLYNIFANDLNAFSTVPIQAYLDF